MQISITGRHMDITDAIREHAHERLERSLLEFPRIQSVHLILDIEKYRHFAEVVIHAAKNIRIDAKEESEDMYVSIDRAIDKAQKQLRRIQDKRQDHKSRDGIADVEIEVQSMIDRDKKNK